MNNQVIEQLGRILNTLTLVETSGKNTLLMADCIRALDEVCQVMTEEMQNENTAVEEDCCMPTFATEEIGD